VSKEIRITREKLGTCQICGKDLYSIIYKCDLCGKETCAEHIRALVNLEVSVGYVYTASTLVPIAYSAPTTRVEMFICSQCADALALSLRVLAGRNKDEDKDHGNKDNST
jgi:hypothetical protein